MKKPAPHNTGSMTLAAPLGGAALSAGATNWTNQVGTYDGAKRGNRASAPAQIRGEDDHLKPRDRAALTGQAMNQRRNFSLVKWGIKTHLDYVSNFIFQMKMDDKNEALNEQIESLMKWWGNAKNCDQTQRFSLRQIIRLTEATRTVGGDVLLVKNLNGRVQLVEPDRICMPTDKTFPEGEKWIQGVRIGKSGQPDAYCICERGSGTERKFQALVSAADAVMVAYRERHDQYRGISPLADALNDFQDLYEAKDYALAKIKLAQLFGVKIKRSATTDATDGLVGAEAQEAANYDINLTGGPFQLDMEQGDDAEFMESANPSSETQAYMASVIMMALKCLDLDYSFFDSSHTNYYGGKAAKDRYLIACEPRQDDLIDALDNLTAWIIGIWIDAGVLVLPAGMTVSDLKWDWIPRGVAFWDKQKDALGTASMIAMNLETYEDTARETGTDVKENIRRNAAIIAYAKSLGVPIMLPGVQGLNVTNPATPGGAQAPSGAPDIQAIINAMISDPAAMQAFAEALKSAA